jgi:uncharacterized protein YggL (DUF469 family)
MNKRLRKKLHKKEFAEYGVSFEAKIIPYENFINVFIDKIESLGLKCVGRFDEQGEISVIIEIGTLKQALKNLSNLKQKMTEIDFIEYSFGNCIINLWENKND